MLKEMALYFIRFINRRMEFQDVYRLNKCAVGRGGPKVKMNETIRQTARVKRNFYQRTDAVSLNDLETTNQPAFLSSFLLYQHVFRVVQIQMKNDRNESAGVSVVSH